jgi:tetratricopeptide (TPR) repeat protein
MKQDIKPIVSMKTAEQLQADRNVEFINNYSIYREFIKQNDYVSALPYWRKVYQLYPISTVQLYIDGVRIYESLMNQASEVFVKASYLDSMMMIFDKRIECFNNDETILGRKAEKYLIAISQPEFKLNENELVERLQRGYRFAKQSIEKSENYTEPAVLVLFIQATKRLYGYKVFSKSDVFNDYEKIMAILEYQQNNDESKAKAEQTIPIVMRIVESCNILDCNSLVEFYEPIFISTPSDTLNLKKIINILRNRNCAECKLFASISERLYDLKPTPERANNLANIFVKERNFEKAFAYYEKAYSNTEIDSSTRATYCYNAALLALRVEKYPSARDIARKALILKPNFCEALILIGDIYGQASKTFSDDDFEKSTVFWLVQDYYEKALQIAPCNLNENIKKNIYFNYFPNKEEIFFRNLTDGQPYKIGGWINETTTVRVKK